MQRSENLSSSSDLLFFKTTKFLTETETKSVFAAKMKVEYFEARQLFSFSVIFFRTVSVFQNPAGFVPYYFRTFFVLQISAVLFSNFFRTLSLHFFHIVFFS